MPLSERRLIENEMIFRRANEKIGINLDKIDLMNQEDGNPELVRTDDLRIEFQCECSDENCIARIPLQLSTYQRLHLNRGTFIVRPHHQVPAIEKVLLTEPNYTVVRKNKDTTEPGKKLNKTSVSNT